MSKSYTVQSGDRLTRISQRFYGTPDKYPLIIQANPVLGERKIKKILAADGLPIIYTGQKLIIPDEIENIINQFNVENPPLTIDTEFDSALTVVIDGLTFQFFTGYQITSNVGTLDTVSISSPYFDNDEYRNSFQPLNYKTAHIYYGKDLFFTGTLIAPNSDVNESSETLSLNFYPKCGILADCNLPISYYPLELNNLNIKQIAENIASVFSIKVEFIGDPGGVFEKVSLSPSEKPFDFIIDLAKKKGFLVTNNKLGDLLIWKANIESPVSFIKEGELPYISCNPEFDPQNYFSSITGLTPETETKDSDSHTWENPFLTGITRPLTIEINDIDDGDLKQTVEATAGRMFGNNKYSLSLNTHRDQNGDMLEKNKTIRVFSPKANILKEYDFLISNVALSRDENGNRAGVNITLPGAFTGELPEAVPWVV